MLILARKPGEAILIVVGGVTIARVEINRVNGKQVRLGLEAGKAVTFSREELTQAVKP